MCKAINMALRVDEYIDELKDRTDVVSASNNFRVTRTEKLNIQQIQKNDAISILKYSLP
jgi:hypothetical protein